MKAIKKEAVIAIALALTIIALSIFYNTPREDSFGGTGNVRSGDSSTSALVEGFELGASERVQIMDADIQGMLKNGTFETVVPLIEELTREKGGFIVTESMVFQNGLWSGNIVSKLPPTNASAFTMGARQTIAEYGRVVRIQITIREFTVDPNATAEEEFSTIETFLAEELMGDGSMPSPIVQLASVFPILATGLVWIAEGLIVGVPLSLASLGVVMLVRRIIIPLWKKELSKPM